MSKFQLAYGRFEGDGLPILWQIQADTSNRSVNAVFKVYFEHDHNDDYLRTVMGEVPLKFRKPQCEFDAVETSTQTTSMVGLYESTPVELGDKFEEAYITYELNYTCRWSPGKKGLVKRGKRTVGPIHVMTGAPAPQVTHKVENSDVLVQSLADFYMLGRYYTVTLKEPNVEGAIVFDARDPHSKELYFREDEATAELITQFFDSEADFKAADLSGSLTDTAESIGWRYADNELLFPAFRNGFYSPAIVRPTGGLPHQMEVKYDASSQTTVLDFKTGALGFSAHNTLTSNFDYHEPYTCDVKFVPAEGTPAGQAQKVNDKLWRYTIPSAGNQPLYITAQYECKSEWDEGHVAQGQAALNGYNPSKKKEFVTIPGPTLTDKNLMDVETEIVIDDALGALLFRPVNIDKHDANAECHIYGYVDREQHKFVFGKANGGAVITYLNTPDAAAFNNGQRFIFSVGAECTDGRHIYNDDELVLTLTPEQFSHYFNSRDTPKAPQEGAQQKPAEPNTISERI